jgi:hypothetical protein
LSHTSQKSILLDPTPRPSWYESFEKEQMNTRASPLVWKFEKFGILGIWDKCENLESSQ